MPVFFSTITHLLSAGPGETASLAADLDYPTTRTAGQLRPCLQAGARPDLPLEHLVPVDAAAGVADGLVSEAVFELLFIQAAGLDEPPRRSSAADASTRACKCGQAGSTVSLTFFGGFDPSAHFWMYCVLMAGGLPPSPGSSS